MIASELVNNDLPVLKTSDTVQKAMDMMSEYKVFHLPVVNESQYLGLVYEDDMLGQDGDTSLPIGALSLSLPNIFSLSDKHLFEILNLFLEHKLSLLPIVTHKNDFIGSIAQFDLGTAIAEIFSTAEQGAVVCIDMNIKMYSLAQIAQIVESENIKILSSCLQYFHDSSKIEVTLKVNKPDISALLASFVRYGYTVKYVYDHSSHTDSSADRYESFMKYLDI